MKNISSSACPHDCPSTCALEIQHTKEKLLFLKGSRENSYTKGVICAKVSRYRERTHSNKRLKFPMKRSGNKGEGKFKKISWNEAIRILVENLNNISSKYGSSAIWPYYYAGTMGLLQRDGINKLRHYFNYSGQYSTICNTLPQAGWLAGVGSLIGTDPREIIDSKVVIMWGGNPASTQVNFMKHVQAARKNNNAKLIVIDPYSTKTAKLADIHIKLFPGTDGALACAIMHNLIKKKQVDLSYINNYTKDYYKLEKHLKEKTPKWASIISGVPINKINQFSDIIARNKKVYFRLGYGFTRQRNGSFNMHAVTCIPTLRGSWKYKGGGAFYSNGGIYKIDKTLIEGLNFKKQAMRQLDQSRIGPVLNNDESALINDIPIKGLFIQNTNPLVVAPDTNKVRKGFRRKDLFVCVHEQFMTETARYADLLLPATSFVEHNDFYISGGHQHLTYGPKLINEIGLSWSNHKLINKLGKSLGGDPKIFSLSEENIIDQTLKISNLGTLDQLKKAKFLDLQPSYKKANFINGFGHKDKKFHFSPEWKKSDPEFNKNFQFPDHYPLIEKKTKRHPFKLITAPAHNFLNTSFTETISSLKIEKKPTLKLHPDDMIKLKISEDELVEIGNERGSIKIHIEKFPGVIRGVTICEGIWPNEYFIGNLGVNALVGADRPEPAGGGVFHDVAIWIKKISN